MPPVQRRPVTVVIKRRPPLAPIPAAVFREPQYRDGKPYAETADAPEPDDEWDDAA